MSDDTTGLRTWSAPDLDAVEARYQAYVDAMLGDGSDSREVLRKVWQSADDVPQLAAAIASLRAQLAERDATIAAAQNAWERHRKKAPSWHYEKCTACRMGRALGGAP